jgi:UPF0716 protein FxsA
MPYMLLLLIITLPLLEIYVLIKAGGLIGAIPTIALVVFSAVLGTLLLRWQGLITLQRGRASLARGEWPAADLLDGLIVLISGILLLIPGLLSDIAGLLCLIPALRRRMIWRFFTHRPPVDASQGSPPARPGPHVIEGEYWKEQIKD